MKIISKYRDFYDSLSNNSDKSNIFVRTEKIEGLPLKYNGKQGRDGYSWEISISGDIALYTRLYKYILERGIIGFCGEIYPFFKVSKVARNDQYGETLKTVFCYDFESLEKEINLDAARVDYLFNKTEKIHLKNWLQNGVCEMGSYFSRVGPPLVKHKFFLDAFLKYRIPYFVYFNGEIKANPILKDFQFYKKFDIVSTFSKLEQFMANNLAPQDKSKAWPVSDVLKAESHGFNKFSFRKDKST